MLAETDKPTTDSADAAAAAERALQQAGNDAAFKRATKTREALKVEAARAAPAAIAAGTTERERDLIAGIFAAIPDMIAASQAHSQADAERDDDRERELHDVWDAQRRAIEVLAKEVVDLPPESPAEALRRVKLFRQVLAFSEGAPVEDSYDGIFEEDFRILGEGAIRALERLAAPVADRSVWDAAVAAVRAAEANLDAVDAEAEAFQHRLVESAPDWLVRRAGSDGKAVLICDNVARFDRITEAKPGRPAECPSLNGRRDEFLAWASANEPLIAAYNGLCEAYDDAHVQLCDVERAMMETPAPDLMAAAFKQERLARELDDNHRGFDDPVYFAVARDLSYVTQAWPAHIFCDLRRLTGQPIPEFETFRPRDWQVRFSAVGGVAALDSDGETLVTTCAAPPDGDMVASGQILAELEAGRAKEVLVRYLQEIS